MQNWLFILVNVCVAAFVGGITNHFAIKCCFIPVKKNHPGPPRTLHARTHSKAQGRNSRVVGTCGLGLPGDKRGFAGAYSKAGVSG